MPQTIADIEITYDSWVSLNTESGIAVGTAVNIQNKGIYTCVIAEGTQPTSVTSTDGELIYPARNSNEGSKQATAGSLELWARCLVKGKSAYFHIQEI